MGSPDAHHDGQEAGTSAAQPRRFHTISAVSLVHIRVQVPALRADSTCTSDDADAPAGGLGRAARVLTAWGSAMLLAGVKDRPAGARYAAGCAGP